ncbi:MAG: hypothetical protein Q8S21_04955 [Candidatus Paracaedibacteraceae bacterium]|nr:hypothetical protein [Candidatus Paracaedibacteraceae bacterium]
MFDLKSVIIPIALGVFGGFLGPIFVEKWKGKEEDSRKIIVIEERLNRVEEKTNNLSIKLEQHMTSMEAQLKELGFNISNNVGMLKGRLVDLPLETPPAK